MSNSQIINDLVTDALAMFAGETIPGEQLEAHTGFRYQTTRGRTQTFGSYIRMIAELERRGVIADSGTYMFPAIPELTR